jgi:hypothetical protein
MAGKARFAAACVALSLYCAPSAQAITNGQPDDGEHPYVGAVVTHDGKDRKKRLICSGTLMSPTVFLTTAHCLLDEPSDLYVSFDAFVGAPYVGPEVNLHPGTGISHPEFVSERDPGDSHDIAVIKLDPPVTDITPARLPALGAVDHSPASATELVGFGREGYDGKRFFGGGGRRFAFGAFSSLEPYKLTLDQSGTLGGTCNGDSGGPVLLEGTRTVVGLTSDGDTYCQVDGIYYRTDTTSARAFLDDFMPMPRR